MSSEQLAAFLKAMERLAQAMERLATAMERQATASEKSLPTKPVVK
jgi:hypothetical protein